MSLLTRPASPPAEDSPRLGGRTTKEFLAVASLMVGAFVTLAPTDAHAASYSFDSSIVDVTTGVTNATVFGDTMDGLKVTVFFSGGGQETKTWADTGPFAGAASGTGWSLTFAGDTFAGVWSFTGTTAIDGLSLSGVGVGTVFDVDAAADTPGSGGGISWACTFLGPPACQDAHVTYSHVVAVGASPPQGDLWHVVDVRFSAPLESFGFIQDTDNDVASAVPEPGTLLLLGSGFSALALRRRRNS